jgi:hypothetical protein
MGGQIVDASVIEERRPRLSKAEKDTIRGGGTPGHWSKARTAQIDREGRWTIKRGRKRDMPPGRTERRAAPEIAVPMLGYKNHVGIDREHDFVRRYIVTHAAAHDGAQLGRVLDRDNTAASVCADSTYRPKTNLALLARRGLRAEFQHEEPRGKPLTSNIARGNATRARIRSHVEHVFAAQKHRIGLVIRTIGPVRARANDRSRQPGLQLHPPGLARQTASDRMKEKPPRSGRPIHGPAKSSTGLRRFE